MICREFLDYLIVIKVLLIIMDVDTMVLITVSLPAVYTVALMTTVTLRDMDMDMVLVTMALLITAIMEAINVISVAALRLTETLFIMDVPPMIYLIAAAMGVGDMDIFR
jgi:hypothetical protein